LNQQRRGAVGVREDEFDVAIPGKSAASRRLIETATRYVIASKHIDRAIILDY